jgi:zinc transporter ZupT
VPRKLQEESDPGHHSDAFPTAFAIAGASFVFLVLVNQAIESLLHRQKHVHSSKPTAAVNSDLMSVASLPSDACQHHHACRDLEEQQSPGENHHSTECCDVSRLSGMSELSAMTLFSAMCIHAVLEGMILGSAESFKVLLTAFLGVGLHKIFEAFAVGSSLISAKYSTKKFIIFSLILCLSSPFGALLGYLITTADLSHSFSGGIINSIAAGTFLQVATMEMLPRAFTDGVWRLPKSLLFAAGFGVVCLFTYKFPHLH